MTQRCVHVAAMRARREARREALCKSTCLVSLAFSRGLLASQGSKHFLFTSHILVSQEEQPGEFAKASEEVLKTRRIIKARRAGGGLASTQAAATAVNGAPSAAETPAAAKSSNPFAGVSLLGATPQQVGAACKYAQKWCRRPSMEVTSTACRHP